MVLDTKSKKFNYSLGVKIVAVVLSLIMVGASAAMLFNSLSAASFYGDASLLFENKKISYMNSLDFQNRFNSDISAVSDYYSYDTSVYKYLVSSKKSVTEDCLKEYQKYYKAHSSSSVSTEEEEFFEFRYVKSLFFKSKEYTFTFVDYDGDLESVKETISQNYDEFCTEQSGKDTFDEAKSTINDFKNFKYLILDKAGKTVATNLKSKNPKKEILSSPLYYVSNYGKVSSNNSFANKSPNSSLCSNSLNAYFSLDCTLSGTDDYLEISNYSASVQSKNISAQFFSGLILFVLSMAAAVFVFANCGRKNDYDGIKLAFIDCVPLDVNLLVSGGLVVLFGYILAMIMRSYVNDDLMSLAYIQMFSLAVAVISAFCLAIFENFVCSLVRIIKAKTKPFWKNILFFVIIHLVFRFFARIIRKFISLFSYKPKNYKKSIAAVGIIYAVVNFIILMILCFSGITHSTLSILFFIGLYILNMFLDFKAVKYFISLDGIIDCAKNREYYSGVLDKLPSSLKTLAESLKYTNDELQNAVTKAVKDERLKAELITNVSHDLKTPLTSIITYVDLLSKCDIQDEDAKKYIAVLDEKGAKLKRLIDDLIEASKVESGNITLNMVNLNLSELAAQAVGESSDDFEKANLEMVFKESANPVSITADGAKTFRIIENLLSNAKKYSALGTRIYSAVYEDNGYGVFEIKNISADQLDISPEELTERFVRGDKSRTKSGNGLGLSIAKELCKAQGGELELIIDGDMFKAKAKFPLANNLN